MDDQNTCMKNFSIELKWAINFSIATLLWMILEKSVGLHDKNIEHYLLYSSFFGIVAIVLYFFAMLDKKKNYFKGNMTWREGFTSGIILSFIIALLCPLVQYVIFTYITPHFFENFIALAVSKKSSTPEQAAAYFNLKSYVLQSIFGALSMGVITSALVALIIKTKKPN